MENMETYTEENENHLVISNYLEITVTNTLIYFLLVYLYNILCQIGIITEFCFLLSFPLIVSIFSCYQIFFKSHDV